MFNFRKKAGIFGEQVTDFLEAFNYGLRNQQLVQDAASGRIDAHFYNCSLTSVFQPVVHAASGRTVGHHGLLRASGADGASLSPWGVFSFAVVDHELVDLDRLCRTLHVLNYYRTAPERDMVYLNVQLRLLQVVGRDFGRAFENRLERLGLGPGQVAIILPQDLLAHGDLLEVAITDYQALGYRVVASYPSSPGQWPTAGTVRADVIRVDGRDFATVADAQKAVHAIHGNGALALAQKLETAEQLERAREAGFDLLQGHAAGVTVSEPLPPIRHHDGVLQTFQLW